MQLFFPRMGDIAPCSIGLCFKTLLVLCSITRSSWSINSIGCLEWKITLSNSNIKDDITHRGKNFQTELILCVIEDAIQMDNWTGQIHEGTSEIMMTWLESGPTPCRVLAWNQRCMSSTRANGRCLWNRHNMARWYTWTKGYTWLGVNDVHALFRKVKQGCETNKETLMFIKSERRNRHRARIWLVVAIRLQAQHPYFRLRTSSNTPSIRKKM
jgi:hypothetical protein